MTEQGHNGWTNYETWAVHLWLTNEEPSYRYWRERAVRCSGPGDLSVELRDEVRDAAPDLGPSMYADMLGAALDRVNWYEIAEALLEE